LTTNSYDAKATLRVGDRSFEIFRLDALQSRYDVARLPFSLKILLENLLRNEDGESIRAQDIEALATWDAKAEPSKEIAFTPARVLMQDFTGVPAVVDLAAMRDAIRELGGDPAKINPLVPAELVIDHSVQVDVFGSRLAFARNAELEFERNQERYAFLRWGQEGSRTSRSSRQTPASSTRSTSSTWPGSCSSVTVRHTPTRWSAPIPTRR
jgi:aconitate hydratase